MIRNALKRIMPLLLALLVMLSFPFNAAAAEFDLSAAGTIRVQLREEASSDVTVGGSLRLYKVGDAQEINNNLTFSLCADFSGSGVSLADLSASGLPQQLADYALENDLQGTAVQTDETGYAVFSDLSTGLYLVMQTEAAEGYLPVMPFLVSLPMYSEESGSWLYSIEATPKVQASPKEDISVTVIKKWLDNNKNRPEYVSVSLLKDDVITDTVRLTAENGWQYTWENLKADADWSVEENVPEGYRAEYAVYKNTTTITNRASWYVPPTDVLIQTGQLNWPVPILVCAGLFLLVIGCALLRRGKKHA